MISLPLQRDKWVQYGILRKDASLAGQLPETQLLKDNALKEMLLKYPSVVLKPRDGRYGRDIIFIKRSSGDAYRIQNEKNKVTLPDTDKLLQWLRKEHSGRGFIVQRRLQLAQIGRRPFDIRIMVQRKKASASAWKVTGSYAKVASRGYLVTNVASRTIPVLEALKLAKIEDRSLLIQAEQTALLAARQLQERYPGLRQVGFDIGIDKQRRIWIIEGNYRPDLRPFRLLKDTAMRRRILWYKEH